MTAETRTENPDADDTAPGGAGAAGDVGDAGADPTDAGETAAGAASAIVERVTARAGRSVRTYWPLLVVMAIALAIRLLGVYSWHPQCATPGKDEGCYSLSGDAYHYHSVANNVAHGNGYVISDYAGNEEARADHPPGYITFLATLDRIGLQSVGQHRFVLTILGSITVGLIGLLGWRLGGPRGPATGVVAGLLAAIYPGFWMNEVYYMGESLFVPFVALTLLAAYRYWRLPTLGNAALMGLAGGGAWQVRGESILVLAFIVLGTVIFLREIRFLRRLLYGLLAGAICVAMMMPWIFYNLSRFDEPIFIAGTGPAVALNSCDETWYGEATGWYSFQCLRRYSKISIQEHGEIKDSALREQGTAYIRENIGRLPTVMAVRVGREFGVYEIDDTFERNVRFEGRRRDFIIQFEAMYRFMIPFAIIGLVSMRRRRLPISPIIGTIIAVAVGVSTTFAIWRYRLAADVTLVACAGVGIVALGSWLWTQIGKRLLTPAEPW